MLNQVTTLSFPNAGGAGVSTGTLCPDKAGTPAAHHFSCYRESGYTTRRAVFILPYGFLYIKPVARIIEFICSRSFRQDRLRHPLPI